MAVLNNKELRKQLKQMDEYACQASTLYTNAALDSIEVVLKDIRCQNEIIIDLLRSK